jgi:hypothetical protein
MPVANHAPTAVGKNQLTESFMKTLKQEEVNARTYADINDARRQSSQIMRSPWA